MRGNLGVCRGKHYFEARVSDEGLCRVGWASTDASLELGEEGVLVCIGGGVVYTGVYFFCSNYRKGQVWFWIWRNREEI